MRVSGARLGRSDIVGPSPNNYTTSWGPQPTYNNWNYSWSGPGPNNGWSRPASPTPQDQQKEKLTSVKVMRDDDHIVYIGLRVYVNYDGDVDPVKQAVEITGRIGEEFSEDEGDRSSASGRSQGRTPSRSISRNGSERSRTRNLSPPRSRRN